MATTVETLRTLARQRADMENRNFVSATEWITYINDGYKELYDILVSKFEDWYSVSSTFTVASGATSYTLPDDFYKLRGVDRSDGGSDYYPLRPFSFENRNRKGFYQRYRGVEPSVQYRLYKNTLLLSPDDQAPGDYRLWYIPRATDLTTTSQSVDGVNGWEDYIVISAAIKALIKEESDVSVLMAERQRLAQRIEWMAQNRDAGATERVGDVTSAGFYEPFFYR